MGHRERRGSMKEGLKGEQKKDYLPTGHCEDGSRAKNTIPVGRKLVEEGGEGSWVNTLLNVQETSGTQDKKQACGGIQTQGS